MSSVVMDSEAFVHMLLEGLLEFQRRGVLCDTMLRAQGGEVLAHSAVLAAASAKLKRELIRPDSEPGTQHIVELPDFMADDVRRLLEYIYSGNPGKSEADPSGVVALCETLEIPLPSLWIEQYTTSALTETVLKAEKELLDDSVATADDDDLCSIVNKLCESENSSQNLTENTESPSACSFPSTPISGSIHEYKCEVCGREFKRLAALRLHSRNHTGKTPKQKKKETPNKSKDADEETDCPASDQGTNDCFVYNDDELAQIVEENDTTDSANNAIKEVKMVGAYKPRHRVCETCGAEFECSAHLYAHRRREHVNKDDFLYVCDCCDRRFPFPSLLLEHRAMHDFTVCELCGVQFQTFYEVYRHRFTHHADAKVPGAGGVLNLCRVCGRCFPSRLELRQHRLSHLQCRCCGLWFLKPSKLRRHEPSCVRRSSKKIAAAAAAAVTTAAGTATSTDEVKSEENSVTSDGFLCGVCGKRFEKKTSYISHKRVHVSAEYWQGLYSSAHHTCHLCGRAFLKPSRLQRHLIGCQIRFAKRWVKTEPDQEAAELLHELTVSQPAPEEAAMVEQELEVIGEQYTCVDCGRIFDKMASLASHKKVHAPDEFRCQTCGKVFPKRYYLVAHERKHSNERPFSCEHCGLCFKQPGQVHRHTLRRHSGGARPHMCTTCGRTFTVKSDLRDHERIHTGERAHMCDQCGRRFRTRGILRVHERQHTGVMPFACAYCGRRFAQLSNRLKHEVIHTGEFPLRCEQCGRGFADTSALRRHELYHSGIRPHACPICGRTFTLKSSLKAHILIHSKVRQHVCPVCQKAFVLRNGLVRHLKIHTRKGMIVPDLAKFQGEGQQTLQYIPVEPKLEAKFANDPDSGDEVSYEPEVMHEMYIAENVVEVAVD